MSKRPLVLMTLLLALLGAYLAADRWSPDVEAWWELRKNPPLPGENKLANVQVTQKDDYTWNVSFDYYYTGKPLKAKLEFVVLERTVAEQKTAVRRPLRQIVPERGQHTVKFEYQHPTGGMRPAWADSFSVELGAGSTPAVQVALAQKIDWLDRNAIAMRPENVVQRATSLIDNPFPENLQQAKEQLDALVLREPRYAPAYVQLARHSMKSRGISSPEAVRQAETMLQSALQIESGRSDAQVLLAQLYAHQRRFGEAEALLTEAGQKGNADLWHPFGWGELFQLQGREDEAIAKYREVLAHPPRRDRNDRARNASYDKLLEILDARNDAAGVEALLQQRVKDYPGDSCAETRYGAFMVHQRADADAAIASVRMPDGGCENLRGKDVLGMAHYLRWTRVPEEARAEALRQGRVFLPSSARMFYLLAQSDTMLAVGQKLKAAGDNVSVLDNAQRDALSYALHARNHAVAQRLLRMGARTDTLVGPEQMPVWLVPVLVQDIEGVQLMRRAGVDYARVRFQGLSPAEIARRLDNAALARALDPKAGSL